MKYDFSYIYSKTSACKILKRKDIIKVEIWANCIWVRFVKGSRFVSKKEFTALFAKNRQEAGREIAVQGNVSHQVGTLYAVQSQSLEGHYNVELDRDCVVCDCKDYSIQRHDLNLKKATCKHGYGVLYTLGYNTLAEYIKQDGFYRLLPVDVCG